MSILAITLRDNSTIYYAGRGTDDSTFYLTTTVVIEATHFLAKGLIGFRIPLLAKDLTLLHPEAKGIRTIHMLNYGLVVKLRDNSLKYVKNTRVGAAFEITDDSNEALRLTDFNEVLQAKILVNRQLKKLNAILSQITTL